MHLNWDWMVHAPSLTQQTLSLGARVGEVPYFFRLRVLKVASQGPDRQILRFCAKFLGPAYHLCINHHSDEVGLEFYGIARLHFSCPVLLYI